MPQTPAAASQTRLWGAVLALTLLAAQLGGVALAPGPLLVRVVLPATVATAPLALWPYRDRLGTWVIFVGLAANLTAILANGGLMPIERATVVEAVGAGRAAGYAPGAWVPRSKDVLVASRTGRLTALGDTIVVRLRGGGIVASAGDVVVLSGVIILCGEASLAWQRRRREVRATRPGATETEGGAVAS